MKKLLTILISGIILSGCNNGGSVLSNNLSQPVNNSQINKVTTLDIAVHDNLNYVTDGAQKKNIWFSVIGDNPGLLRAETPSTTKSIPGKNDWKPVSVLSKAYIYYTHTCPYILNNQRKDVVLAVTVNDGVFFSLDYGSKWLKLPGTEGIKDISQDAKVGCNQVKSISGELDALNITLLNGVTRSSKAPKYYTGRINLATGSSIDGGLRSYDLVNPSLRFNALGLLAMSNTNTNNYFISLEDGNNVRYSDADMHIEWHKLRLLNKYTTLAMSSEFPFLDYGRIYLLSEVNGKNKGNFDIYEFNSQGLRPIKSLPFGNLPKEVGTAMACSNSNCVFSYVDDKSSDLHVVYVDTKSPKIKYDVTLQHEKYGNIEDIRYFTNGDYLLLSQLGQILLFDSSGKIKEVGAAPYSSDNNGSTIN